MDDTIPTPDVTTQDYAPNILLGTDADGTTWSTDNSGTPYISGRAMTPQESAMVTIPNGNEAGQGPGGDPVSTSFQLGNVAQGIQAIGQAVSSATTAGVNAIRQAKTAVVAANTPTPTAQWLQMPLQTQLLIGLAFFAVLMWGMKGKL